MNANDFALPIGNREEDWAFGASGEQTASTLRDIANRIDQGKIAIQSCKVASIAKLNDFAYTSITISFAEKKRMRPMKGKPVKPEEAENTLKEFMNVTCEVPEDFKENMRFAEELQKKMKPNLFNWQQP